MFSWLATLLVIILLAVATSHAAGMGVLAAGAGHAESMAISAPGGSMACDGGQGCMAMDAGMCASICAGLTGILPAQHVTAPARRTVTHNTPAGLIVTGRRPGPPDRPPETRLL